MHVRDPKPGDTCAPPPWDGVVSDIDLHGNGTNRNPAESTGFALNGYRCCGNTAGMELKLAGFCGYGIYYLGKSMGCV